MTTAYSPSLPPSLSASEGGGGWEAAVGTGRMCGRDLSSECSLLLETGHSINEKELYQNEAMYELNGKAN